MTAISCPPNPNSNYFNYFAALCAIGAFFWARSQDLSGLEASLWIVGIYAGVIIMLEVAFLRTPWRDSVGLDFTRKETVPHRIATKLIGVYGSYGFVALLYWLFPEYHGSYYDPYYEAISRIAAVIGIATVPYVVFMDQRMIEPKDSYYWFGRCLLLDFEGAKWQMILQHMIGWIVKGFFLPLMFVSFVGNIKHLSGVNFEYALDDFKLFFRTSQDVLFTLDLLGAVAGYTFAIRLFDSHLRSAEPTVGGWFICLMCYQPFLSVFMRYYLVYSNNNWMDWLDDSPTLQVVWGSTALLFLSVYTLASLNFGIRFSNLTHRGVLTKGMYRFTKHPAYVSKNTFWWLTYIPFVPMNGWLDVLRYCLLMVGISGVYYLRARTEERHLSRDPVYVQYALYMNDHSVFRKVASWLPFLKYKAPKDWEKLPVTYNGIKG